MQSVAIIYSLDTKLYIALLHANTDCSGHLLKLGEYINTKAVFIATVGGTVYTNYKSDKTALLIEGRFSGVENRLSGVENRLSGLENKVSNVENQLVEVKSQITKLNDRMERIEFHVTRLSQNAESRFRIITAIDNLTTAVRESKVGGWRAWLWRG